MKQETESLVDQSEKPGSIPFIAGLLPVSGGILARYLPPLPEGVIKTWLTQNLPIESDATEHPLLLDPFGTSPQMTIEAARAGYRILVTVNNPVLRLLHEVSANPPSKSELKAALAELADSYKGNERLEPHLRGLYITQCENCKREVEAESFIWKREGSFPESKVYECPICFDSGERPTKDFDKLKMASFPATGLHLARALERVVPPNDPDRHHVEDAISTYLPRALYAVVTLVNKLESLSISPTRRRDLSAMLLFAFDRANSLWSHPSSRLRPRLLSIPPNYFENNIWLALEQAVTALSTPIGYVTTNANPENQRIPFSIWPKLPPAQGGITIFEGRLKDLVPYLDQLRIQAVMTVIPRPNLAFWTLSALWAGWLLGQQAIGSFKNVLHRRRYDFAWHTSALESAFNLFTPHLPENTPFIGWLGEVDTGFLSATLIAAEMAGLAYQGLALSSQKEQAIIEWQLKERRLPDKKNSLYSNVMDISNIAAQDYLLEIGEPAESIQICIAILSSLIGNHMLPLNPIDSPSDTYSQVQDIFEKTIFNPVEFKHYGGNEKSLESGKWWVTNRVIQTIMSTDQTDNLSQKIILSKPLADRVELSVIDYLINHPGCNSLPLESTIYNEYKGLLTPNSDLIQTCLESYGFELSHPDNQWFLKPSDFPEVRRTNLLSAKQQIKILAERFGYKTIQTGINRVDDQSENESGFLWLDRNELFFVFYFVSTAIFTDVIISSPHPAQQCIIIVPAERADLVSYKLRHDERLSQILDTGWRFCTVQQVDWLIENDNLTMEQIIEQFTPTISIVDNPQMRLL